MKIHRVSLSKILSLSLLVVILFPFSSAFDKDFSHQEDTSEVKKHLDLYLSLLNTDSINARINLEKALILSKTTGYLKGIASSTSYLGKYYLEQFNLRKAENFFMESFEAYKRSGNKTEEANCANNLGTIAEKSGEYGNAVSYYLYAYELFDSLNNINGLSATTNNLGIVYYLLDETPKALNFLKMSLSIKQRLEDSVELVFAYQNLGNVYFDSWNYDSSQYYYQKCIDLSESVNDLVSAGKAYNSLGVISMIENDYQSALEHYSKALEFSRVKNDVRNISAIYDNIGLLEFYSGQLQTAIAYFDSSLTISRRYELKEEMKNSYQHLASVYARQENYKDAFNNLQNYEYLQNDLLKEKGNVAGIEALFIKQKQENRILYLEKEQQRHKTKIILLAAAIFVILVVAILGFYIFRLNQSSKHARKVSELEKERFKAVIEAQEMERKRIAGDLHDSVGQMLSLSKLHLSEVMDSSKTYTEDHQQMLQRSSKIIDEVCQEVRNISHNLMPGPLIRLGILAAIKDLVRKINTTGRIHASFSSNMDNRRLDEKVEISIYRIIQEIINNTLKHSGASEIMITLNRINENKLELLVNDNGVGFDTDMIVRSNGIGWKSIYSRLSIINGSMTVNSTKNGGTRIEITI